MCARRRRVVKLRQRFKPKLTTTTTATTTTRPPAADASSDSANLISDLANEVSDQGPESGGGEGGNKKSFGDKIRYFAAFLCKKRRK